MTTAKSKAKTSLLTPSKKGRRFEKPKVNNPVVLDTQWENGHPTTNRPKPLNQEIIELSNVYKEELPNLLKEKIDEARNFFLHSLVPLIVSLDNGIQDGIEILKNAVEEEPDASEVTAMLSQSVKDAMFVKINSYVGKHLMLSEAEQAAYAYLNYTNRSSSDLKELVSILRKNSSTVTRPANEKEMPQLPKVSRMQRRKQNKDT